MMKKKQTERSERGRCAAPPARSHDPWAIEPMPEGLDESPLDFLFADHHRQRQAVHVLLRIAGGEYDESGVRSLVEFLERDFALHIQDEECDFVPLLRRLCPPEDGIDVLAERLAHEHADDKSSVKRVIGILRNLVDGGELNESGKAAIHAFAIHLKQHLAIENGVLLPIARVRMDPDALNALALAIRKRRLEHPGV